MNPLPISILIPTRNCAPLLRGHLKSVRHWSDLAREIVVVDSDSTDGTVETIRADLNHPNLRILSHPPGLYQSWNFGIQKLTGKYAYISTVGDSISREGLQHLYAVAEELRSDVVVSKPDFIDVTGRRLRPKKWPIDDILRSLTVKAPLALEGPELFLLALANCTEAILGSSASDLYRTECLQRHPFPTEYGTIGDAAWGLKYAFRIRFAVTPRRFSLFREHPKAYAASEYHVRKLPERLFQLACETFACETAADAKLKQTATELNLESALAEVRGQMHWQGQLEQCRRSSLPWIFNPKAWVCRVRRQQHVTHIRRMKRRIATGGQRSFSASY